MISGKGVGFSLLNSRCSQMARVLSDSPSVAKCDCVCSPENCVLIQCSLSFFPVMSLLPYILHILVCYMHLKVVHKLLYVFIVSV
jgi:hypothetical protein